MEKAQPQTIMAPDGFPIENLKFCGGAQEIMAVIQGNKPVAASTFDKPYIQSYVYTNLKSKSPTFTEYHTCRPYTYEDVYTASKNVNLVRYQYDSLPDPFDPLKKIPIYYYFLKKNTNTAYLLSYLWSDETTEVKSALSFQEYNIIVGILLGYKKKDICAWFLTGLQSEFNIDFNNLDMRPEVLQNNKILARRDEIIEAFESSWKSAHSKLKDLQKSLPVPKEWKASLTKLDPPL